MAEYEARENRFNDSLAARVGGFMKSVSLADGEARIQDLGIVQGDSSDAQRGTSSKDRVVDSGKNRWSTKVAYQPLRLLSLVRSWPRPLT